MLDVQFYRVSVGYKKKHYLVFIALSVAVRYLKNNPMEISFLNCYCIFPYSINEISPFLFLLTITHIFKETVALFLGTCTRFSLAQIGQALCFNWNLKKKPDAFSGKFERLHDATT